MFTGLIETTAIIKERRVSGGSGAFIVEVPSGLEDLQYGDSVAVNGACLTVEESSADGGAIRFHVLPETLKRTNLGTLAYGSTVNLERALALGERLGGHLVSGHVDAVSEVLDIRRVSSDYEYRISMPEGLEPYFVEKGSVTLDGISLTLIDVNERFFSVQIIPVTIEETALKHRKKGDLVNVETDILGKYIYRQLSFLAPGKRKESVTMDTLRNAGWEF